MRTSFDETKESALREALAYRAETEAKAKAGTENKEEAKPIPVA